LCNCDPLNVACPFIDAPDFRIAIELFNGIVLCETYPTQDFDRLGSDLFGYGRAEVLSHCGLRDKWLSRIAQPRRVVDHQTPGLNLRRHFRQLKLHTLKIGNDLAELLSLTRVSKRMI